MKNRRLKKGERHHRIIAELRKSTAVRISVLAEAFGVTTETLRRDIKELSEQGLVDRTYGGAARSMTGEPAIWQRNLMMMEERDRIAHQAMTLVEAGDVLMIDAGSTTAQFARNLAVQEIDVNVLTNCVAVASILGENPSIRVILCPGEFTKQEECVVGLETLHFLKRFHANKAFIGAGGLTTEGVTEANTHASWIKRTMIERSDRVLLLIDHGKFNVHLLEVVCPLDDLNDIVADQTPDPPLHEALHSASVTFHLAR
jgi:DeoR/GlpR family transcriptional regulator of sugar metabolism